MLIQTAQSMRVAILGSGIAGSTAARTLADRGIQVTVFEAGRGIGGRTSTRITRGDDRYQFDHGAQYISKPKTDAFQQALDQWKRDGWVKEWNGNFGTARVNVGDDGKLQTIEFEKEEEKKERWVGYPGMHSICRNLLHHENIQVRLQTRANANYNNNDDNNDSSKGKWKLRHGTNQKELGSFDWLIATDRNSGAHYRKDLSPSKEHNPVQEFRKGVRSIQSIKSLTAMVVFESSLGLDLDGIQFDHDNTSNKSNGNDMGFFGSLGWAARDTSKPGRDRPDGQECWVLQSHPDAANQILKELKRNNIRKVDDIRTKAKEVLLHDFLKSIPLLTGADGNDGGIDDAKLPLVASAIGHRWGAAFPILSPQYMEMDSQLIADKHFVACGDYFGSLSGRIEGAYLSGVSAADQLCHDMKFNEYELN